MNKDLFSQDVYQPLASRMRPMDLESFAGQAHYLRNAPTKLMKELNHGAEYRYAHSEPGGFAPGENYFPPELQDKRYYFPTDRGLEQKIAEKLDYLKQLNGSSQQQRYADQTNQDEES